MCIVAITRVSWNLESPTSELANPLKHTEPIKQRSFSKPDLGVKQSSDSDIASQSYLHSKREAKRYSQPDLINRRPLKQDLIKIDAKKDNQNMEDNEKKFEALKSIAETDKIHSSNKQLMNISKMKLNSSKPKTSAADKSSEAKPYTVPYKADSNYTVREMAFTEKETLNAKPETEKVKPSAKYDVKVSNAKLLSANDEMTVFEVGETDNKSAISDSGLGSEYSGRTVKTDSLSEISTKTIKTDDFHESVTEVEVLESELNIDPLDKKELNLGAGNTPSSDKDRFEVKSARPKSSRSRSETLSRGSKKSFIGVKKTAASEKKGKIHSTLPSSWQ